LRPLPALPFWKASFACVFCESVFDVFYHRKKLHKFKIYNLVSFLKLAKNPCFSRVLASFVLMCQEKIYNFDFGLSYIQNL